jgi:hypothetical protein
MTRSLRPRLALLRAIPVLLALALAIGACTNATSPSPAPSNAPSPSAAPSGAASPAPSSSTIDTADAAAAAVLATDPRFAGLKPQDPNLIGGCCFYTVVQSATGFDVTIEIGWGDCPAGCIDRHHWIYSVAADGTVELIREDGPPVPAGVPGGGGDGTGGGGVTGIRGIATAGPVCPVVRPNDPNCADRPVVGATIHVLDATGTEVAQLETDANGAFVVTLPPGRYRVQPDPVEGLMGGAQPVDVTVGANLMLVMLSYDTGIR